MSEYIIRPASVDIDKSVIKECREIPRVVNKLGETASELEAVVDDFERKLFPVINGGFVRQEIKMEENKIYSPLASEIQVQLERLRFVIQRIKTLNDIVEL